MENLFMLLPVTLPDQQNTAMILKCNTYTEQFGLQLSEEAIQSLMECRKENLKKYGRIEFGQSILPKLILEFADSAYFNQEDYEELLSELQDCFYYFKRETLEEQSDDELIKTMKLYFEEVCQGSVEYLKSTMLENYARDIRYNTREYQFLGGYEDDYTDFLDWDGRDWD